MLKKSRGKIFRLSTKLKDYIEQRDEYVEDTDMKEKNQRKGIAKRFDCLLSYQPIHKCMITFHIPCVLD
jgi:hypothetical protein